MEGQALQRVRHQAQQIVSIEQKLKLSVGIAVSGDARTASVWIDPLYLIIDQLTSRRSLLQKAWMRIQSSRTASFTS
jgi:hypothetical protein